MLHQVGDSFDLYYDARKHKIKIQQNALFTLMFQFSSSYIQHVSNVLCWLTLHNCVTMHGTKNMAIEDDKHNINESGNEHVYIDVADDNKTYLGLHVKCSTLLLDLNQIWTFFTDFTKVPENKFHRTPASGRRDYMCGQAHRGTISHFSRQNENA